MRRVPAGIAAVTLLALLTGCAPEADPGWAPQAQRLPPGVMQVTTGTDDPGANREGADPGATADPPAASGDDPVNGGTAEGATAGPIDEESLGLVGGRLRNDTLPLQARFVYIPGFPAFNAMVNDLLRQRIAATGVGYEPQVFPVEAGLDDRGCVAGSTTWPASEVLARPETGPAGGAGTAITCEVTAAFGSTLAISFRVVTGSADGVTDDALLAVEADLASGQIVTGLQRWSDAAPAELWERAVEVLRAGAGGLSTAEPAAPSAEQTALAATALHGAVSGPDGTVLVTFAPGLTSPELVALGLPPTADALEFSVDAETAAGWSSEAWTALQAQVGTPFAGVAAAPTDVAFDCTLIPCVAVTYDDGPSPYTPQLLDTLAAEHALATFFLIGGSVPGGADSVARMAAEGHEVASHTMSHADLTTLTPAQARAQVLDAAALITQASGQPVTMYRPPYGAVNAAVIQAVGLPAILWSVDTNDWREPGQAALIERSVPVAAPGRIILFHDTHADSVAVAGDVIRGLRARGFEPVTVTELFGGAVPAGRVASR